MMSGSVIFAAAGAEAGSTFAPLDFAIAGSLVFWALVCFLIYYFVLAPMMIRRSEALIEDREETIRGDLEEAEAANAKAADLLSQYEAELEKARGEASHHVSAVITEAKKTALAEEAKISQKIAQQAAQAEDRIRASLAEAATDLTDSAAVAAQAAVKRLAGLKVTKTVAKNAVKASV